MRVGGGRARVRGNILFQKYDAVSSKLRNLLSILTTFPKKPPLERERVPVRKCVCRSVRSIEIDSIQYSQVSVRYTGGLQRISVYVMRRLYVIYIPYMRSLYIVYV